MLFEYLHPSKKHHLELPGASQTLLKTHQVVVCTSNMPIFEGSKNVIYTHVSVNLGLIQLQSWSLESSSLGCPEKIAKYLGVPRIYQCRPRYRVLTNFPDLCNDVEIYDSLKCCIPVFWGIISPAVLSTSYGRVLCNMCAIVLYKYGRGILYIFIYF